MGTSITQESNSTLINLINKGLSLNIRSLNSDLTELFQRYSIAVNKLNGGELFGNVQVMRLQKDGLSLEYDKSSMVVRNGIDKLQFLIGNRNLVAEAIGVPSSKIYGNRRYIITITEYLQKMDKQFDLGYSDQSMQLYISLHDGNMGSLDSQLDWIDYMMTQRWIDSFASSVAWNSTSEDGESHFSDKRIDYLSDMVQGMMKDHEIEYHSNFDKFNEDEYMDKSHFRKLANGNPDFKNPEAKSKFQYAMNMLNSFGKLDYGFYEIFKPLGRTTEKYIKVKLSTNGELDISGVVGLSDCEHVAWEYGSMDYLRSLNTGNQRYRFKLSRAFNDEYSVLWWKPDDKEQLEIENEEEEGEITEPTGYRYYKPYETERLLRWFGTNYVPVIDPDSITKKTVCSIPSLSDDVESEGFYQDVTNITDRTIDVTRASMDAETSISLLSLAPKSTIDVIPILDEENPDRSGQYLEFIVSGHQQTSNLSFHVTGKMYNSIQEMNHFGSTWKLLNDAFLDIGGKIVFLETTSTMHPEIERQIWKNLNPNEQFIPKWWNEVFNHLDGFQTPNVIDLLRLRQLNLEIIWKKLDLEYQMRTRFLENISGLKIGADVETDGIQQKIQYISSNPNVDTEQANEIMDTISGKQYINQNLQNFIRRFPERIDAQKILDDESSTQEQKKQAQSTISQIDSYYAQIPLSEEAKNTLILSKLEKIHFAGKEQERMRYAISYDDVSVSDLQDTITTFNNLIVRLPTDTYHNKVASRHIFLDWKNFVDSTLEKMVANGKSDDTSIPDDKKLYILTDVEEIGVGTDGKEHSYVEYYTDVGRRNKLIDYSYLYDDDGNLIVDEKDGKPLHDRWDYWSEKDFLDLDKDLNVLED